MIENLSLADHASAPGQRPPAVYELRAKLLITFLLLFCATVPYVNTLRNGFAFDDAVQVLKNPYIQSFRYLPRVFTTSAWSYVGSGSETNYYRPMMTVTYLLCHFLFGFAPFGFHLFSILCHAAVVSLLFLVSLRIFDSRRIALVSSVAFALHPIHTEPVAWIAAVPDLEVTFFYLLTFWCFLTLRTPSGELQWRRWFAMIGIFILALLSKEQALTLPLLASVYEHLYRDRHRETSLLQKFWAYGPLWAIALAYIVFRMKFLGAFAPVSNYRFLSRREVILSAIALVGQYLWKLIWPFKLCAFYVFHPSRTLLDPQVLFGAGALILCLVVFLYLWNHARSASFAMLWFAVTISPVLNAKWVGHNVFAERYLYLPSVGICWLAAWGAACVWRQMSVRQPSWRAATATAAIAIAVLCGARIMVRNRDWKDDLVLFTRTLAVSPEATDVRVNLGIAYDRLGQAKAAEREWLEVYRREPDRIEVLNNLANLYAKEGLYALAVENLQRVIQLAPQFADPHTNLGLVYGEMNMLPQAEQEFRTALALARFNVRAYIGLALISWQRGDRQDAEATLERALSLVPHEGQLRNLLAAFYTQEGRTQEAIRQYTMTLQWDAKNEESTRALQKLRAGQDLSATSLHDKSLR